MTEYSTEKRKISYHPSTVEMYERIKTDGLSNVFDRFEAMDRVRCEFCEEGVSCQLCSNGPCRIVDKAGASKGVCGIDRNAMAMRDMLLRNVMGSSTYAHHAYDAFRTLKSTVEGKTPFSITDEEKLRFFAGKVGMDISGSKEEVGGYLADFLIGELHKGYDEPSQMVESFAPEKRKKIWQDLAIYPVGVMHEIKDATASCLTNVDGDYVSLAKKALRLGIATIYQAQIGLEWVQDILFGTPMPHEVNVDLGILDPDYINILFNGHEPWLGVATLQLIRNPEVQQRARDIGAKGIRVIGSIETGQELLQRFEVDEFFGGLTGDWISIEPMLATGAVDVFAMDENCSLPDLAPYGRKYQATLVSVNDLVRIPGVEENYDYKPPEANEIAGKLIDLALENFKKRKGTVEAQVPDYVTKAIAGFSTEAVLGAIGGKLDPLVDLLKAGKIKGVAGLVSCSTLKNGPQDSTTVGVAKELIKRDILIVSGGCGNHALEVAGLANLDAIELAGDGLKEVCNQLKIPPVLSFGTCTDTGRISTLVTELANFLDVDTSELPVVVTAPEWMEQKATIDAIFALAYGLNTHLSPVPAVTGGPELVKLLTEELEGITGGKILLGDDPVEAVDRMEEVINQKRSALGLDLVTV